MVFVARVVDRPRCLPAAGGGLQEVVTTPVRNDTVLTYFDKTVVLVSLTLCPDAPPDRCAAEGLPDDVAEHPAPPTQDWRRRRRRPLCDVAFSWCDAHFLDRDLSDKTVSLLELGSHDVDGAPGRDDAKEDLIGQLQPDAAVGKRRTGGADASAFAERP